MFKIWDSLQSKFLEWETNGLSTAEKLYQIEKYEFYLALIAKYTYKIFHNHKNYYAKASKILNDPEKYFSTNNTHENKNRMESYEYFKIFSLEKHKIKHLFYKKTTRQIISEYYRKNNEIMRSLFDINKNNIIIFQVPTSERLKIITHNPLFCFFNGFIDLGYITDYEDFFDLLDDKRNELQSPIEITSFHLAHKKKALFEEYPQFEQDYAFFIDETKRRKPYIVETKYWIIWTSEDGILAKYFKSLVPDGQDFKRATIEAIFEISDLKKKAGKNYNNWEEFKSELDAYRKMKKNHLVIV